MGTKIRMLSPDGFDMFIDTVYNNDDEAWVDFIRWKKRYEGQGYYSSNKGRIELDDLKNHMKIIKQ